jgi:Ni2+-binding GTPase involved in maturation of urease and hydrogenase
MQKRIIMKPVRLFLIGGFLGAGKTTLMYKAAKMLTSSGKRVGLITNDQAANLVDTKLLSTEGFEVSEVAGGCFCCNFNGFIRAIESLRNTPDGIDIILAEPVGSCTDLSATILQPLKDRYKNEILPGALTVLLDPLRWKAILSGSDTELYQSAIYIYRKQIEEADIIVVNKSDLLTDKEAEELKILLAAEFPGYPVLFMSCKNDNGLDAWLEIILSWEKCGEKLLELDYNTYAEGEAALGWLNARFALTGGPETDWKQLCQKYLLKLQEIFKNDNSEIGHIKLYLEAGKGKLAANLTQTHSDITIQELAGNLTGGKALMTFNARVQMSPESLLETVQSALKQTASCDRTEVLDIRSLSPSRPQPTHRYTKKI